MIAGQRSIGTDPEIPSADVLYATAYKCLVNDRNHDGKIKNKMNPQPEPALLRSASPWR
jgi:hypothetical protein